MISFFVRMNEVFFQVNDTQSSASFVHDVREDIHFNFGALIVTLHRSDYFDCIVFAIDDIEAFESSPKCTIAQVRINLLNNKCEKVILLYSCRYWSQSDI